MKRSMGEMKSYSALPSALLVAGPQNKLWAPLTQRFARPEAEMFPGLVPLALAVSAVVLLRRAREGSSPSPREVAGWRPRAVKVLDFLAAAAFLAGIAGLAVPAPAGRSTEPGRSRPGAGVPDGFRHRAAAPRLSPPVPLRRPARVPSVPPARPPRGALRGGRLWPGCSSPPAATPRSTSSSSSRSGSCSGRSGFRPAAWCFSTWRSACSPRGASRSCSAGSGAGSSAALSSERRCS